MKGGLDAICGCFPTGRHYPGIAAELEAAIQTTVEGVAKGFAPHTPWKSLPMVVIDFETTGLEAGKDRVLEMGIVCIDNGVVNYRRDWLINPGIPVPEEARKVHGITEEELAQAPTFEAIRDEIVSHIRGRVPIAYNAEFDKKFLVAECDRLPRHPEHDLVHALDLETTWIDPLVWVRELQKYEKGKKLTDVCARMGIELVHAHRAAGDAEATAKVLFALAANIPESYGELIRIQRSYAIAQEAELSAWRARKGTS